MSEVIQDRRRAKIGVSKKWIPKNWLPVYDQMIIYSCMGLSHKTIGEKLGGYGQQQVCNILNTPKTKELKASILHHIRETGITLGERLARIEEHALKNIEHALTDETIRSAHPLAVADRSLAFLKGIGKLESDKPKEEKHTHLYLSAELATKLITGMAKADEAAMLHNHNGIEVRALPGGKDGTKRD